MKSPELIFNILKTERFILKLNTKCAIGTLARGEVYDVEKLGLKIGRHLTLSPETGKWGVHAINDKDLHTTQHDTSGLKIRDTYSGTIEYKWKVTQVPEAIQRTSSYITLEVTIFVMFLIRSTIVLVSFALNTLNSSTFCCRQLPEDVGNSCF